MKELTLIKWKHLTLKQKGQVLQSILYGSSSPPIPVHRLYIDYISQKKGHRVGLGEFMEKKFKHTPEHYVKIGKLIVKL